MNGMIALFILILIIAGITLLARKIIVSILYKKGLKKLIPIQEQIETLKNELNVIDAETKELQALKTQGTELANKVSSEQGFLKEIKHKIDSLSEQEADADKTIYAFQSKIDLYSRLDEFVDYGLYEMPEYLYETSERFALEIKAIREKEKELIKSDTVIVTSGNLDEYSFDLSFVSKVFSSQKKLMIRTFNMECDLLIEKINPANLERTLTRITAVAGDLEKNSADLRYGFSDAYIQLKLEECHLQFQFKLKKKEEQDEQRLIKEQMREEERARREYEAAIVKAEKEEIFYQELLKKAHQEYEQANEAEKQKAALRIQELEQELSEAKQKAERAKSLAEQTKQGHIYVISNIGSFGENVYKIGMTRRLDPMERVKELGDASVPFSFDVHAIIFTKDAPKLENGLHKAFHDHRVNAVNLRKEFFHVDLDDIQKHLETITDEQVEFTKTILAEEYYQTKRLKHA